MKQKIKFLVAMAGPAYPEYELEAFDFQAGDVAEIHAAIAGNWIGAGFAEALSEAESHDDSPPPVTRRTTIKPQPLADAADFSSVAVKPPDEDPA